MPSRLRRLAAENRAPLLALAAGLVVGLAVYGYLSAVVRLAPVVLAASDLPAGTRLERAALRVAYLPEAAVHPRALSTPAQAVGRVTRVPLVAGEQVLAPKLSGEGQGGGPAQGLRAGERGFYLPLQGTDTYPPDLLRPGDRLDLVFVPDSGPADDPTALLLLTGVRVLATFSERTGVLGREAALQGLLLAVTPPEAERLAYALARGRVHLLLNGQEAEQPGGFGEADPPAGPVDAPPAAGEWPAAPSAGADAGLGAAPGEGGEAR